jgi:hypothetical protein
MRYDEHTKLEIILATTVAAVIVVIGVFIASALKTLFCVTSAVR